MGARPQRPSLRLRLRVAPQTVVALPTQGRPTLDPLMRAALAATQKQGKYRVRAIGELSVGSSCLVGVVFFGVAFLGDSPPDVDREGPPFYRCRLALDRCTSEGAANPRSTDSRCADISTCCALV